MSTPSRPTKSIAAASPSAAAALSSSQRLSQDTVDLSAEDSQRADPAHSSTFLGPHANTGAPIDLASLTSKVWVRMPFPEPVGRMVRSRMVRSRHRAGQKDHRMEFAILPGHNWQQLLYHNADGSRWLQTGDGVCYLQLSVGSPNVQVTPECLTDQAYKLPAHMRIPLPAPASPRKQTCNQPAVSATPSRKTRARSPEAAAMESPASRQKVAQEKAAGAGAGAGAGVQRELFPSSKAHMISIPTMAPTPKVAKPVIHRKPRQSTPMDDSDPDVGAESDRESTPESGSEKEEDGSEEEDDDEESASGSGSDNAASDVDAPADADEDDDADLMDCCPNVWYEVERVRRARGSGATREFLVRWKDFLPEEDTWEPRSSFEGTGEEILAAFEAAHAEKDGRTDDDDDDEAEEAESGEEESDGGAAAAPPSSGHNSQRHLQRREEQQEEKRGRILGTKAQAGQRVKNINARRRHITYTDSDEEDLTQ